MPTILAPNQAGPLRIALYGTPKTGKSWLVLSLPNTGRFEGDVIYVAADPGAEEFVPSGGRYIVVKPSPQPTAAGKLLYDPLSEAALIASRDWRADYPKANTLVWDTATYTTREMLAGIADSGAFSDKHNFVGKPGTDSYVAAPMPGDYGAAQRAMMHILSLAFRQPLNLIFVWHGDLVEPNSADTGIVIGGPASVGKAAVTAIGGMFSNLFRCECRERIVPGNPPKRLVQYLVHTERKGPWMAGIRLKPGQQNPITEVEVPTTDPSAFWRKFESALC